MLFCTQQFVLFFTVVFAAYWALPWAKARVWLLLAASFYFYACWSPWLAWIVCVTSTLDFVLARGMDNDERPGRRRLLLYASLAMNLGLLVYFKYANFFLRSLEEGLRAAGAEASLPVLRVILPIGISFYTFEAINYMMDVYRRRIPAERDLSHFMLFILFFPHLVAGPIVRAKDFLPQVSRRKRWDWARAHLGVQFCVLGLFKKLAIADRMGLFVDPVFAAPDRYQTGIVWLAVVAYAIQIYCDFSGYSDLALGTAHLLGYKLSVNFTMPYLSTNIGEFWRRWHISLSSWLRDYVFMPFTLRGSKRRGAPQPSRVRALFGLLVGGSRGSSWRINYGLVLTMAVCGLWHGAAWTYVVVGLLHGFLLVGHRYFDKYCKQRPVLTGLLETAPGAAARVALTFISVALIFALFRAPTVGAAASVYHRLFVFHGGLGQPMHSEGLWFTLLIAAAGQILAARNRWPALLNRVPAPALGFGYAMIICMALVIAPQSDKAFIYFQF